MSISPTKFLYTTHNDLSLELFQAAGWTAFFYDDLDHDVPGGLSPETLVYFRDPFNDPSYHPNPDHINKIIAQYQSTKIIDNITSFADLLRHEDKYLQLEVYQDLYPATYLPSQHTFISGQNLAKPRISQRAKNILFDLGDRVLNDDWIIQDVLDIQEELRVYVVCGDILDQASIKSSKSSGHVKVIGDRLLTSDELAFIHQAVARCPLDVVGFDFAILTDGGYKIIEANRSPQFRRYTERTNINLAALIFK